jgi:hypothetical protein
MDDYHAPTSLLGAGHCSELFGDTKVMECCGVVVLMTRLAKVGVDGSRKKGRMQEAGRRCLNRLCRGKSISCGVRAFKSQVSCGSRH